MAPSVTFFCLTKASQNGLMHIANGTGVGNTDTVLTLHCSRKSVAQHMGTDLMFCGCSPDVNPPPQFRYPRVPSRNENFGLPKVVPFGGGGRGGVSEVRRSLRFFVCNNC